MQIQESDSNDEYE